MQLTRVLCAANTLLILAGCGTAQPLTCLPNEHPIIVETLYFGTATPDGIVAASEWESFVNEAVVPAFPEGLTSWDTSGRWRMATGIVKQETSHILQLTHDGSKKYDTAIQYLMQTYKHEFQQEAVMRIRSQGCRSF
jgi:hypothetical protein